MRRGKRRQIKCSNTTPILNESVEFLPGEFGAISKAFNGLSYFKASLNLQIYWSGEIGC